jgi:hypothetical protein
VSADWRDTLPANLRLLSSRGPGQPGVVLADRRTRLIVQSEGCPAIAAGRLCRSDPCYRPDDAG